jgi:ATP-dependent Clp protease ATP-binding subunit ClpA
VQLEISDGAVAALVSAGFDPVYGARSLSRTLRRQVLVPAADLLVASRANGEDQMQIFLEPAEGANSGVRVRLRDA